MLRLACVIFVLAWLLPAPAAAQGAGESKREFEFAAGYSLVAYGDKESSSLENLVPVGWFLSVAGEPIDRLAVVSEISGEYATTERDGVPVHHRAFIFLNGLRATYSSTKTRTTVFGEGLAGVMHDTGFVNETSSANRFAFRIGGGFDFHMTDRVAARFQAGARFALADPDPPTAFHFLTGIVFSSGKRP